MFAASGMLCQRAKMTTKSEQLRDEGEDKLYMEVPADFPRPLHLGSLPGTQPKFSMTKYKDRFYSPGCSPPELFETWRLCEDLARQLVEKSAESKKGKRSHMSESAILEQYLTRLIATKWTTVPEARWTIRRVAILLSWPVPAASLEPPSNPEVAHLIGTSRA